MISVNGTTIGETEILAEMQYHPAPTREQATSEAAEALIVRELLLQRATMLGIQFTPGATDSEEAAMVALIGREVRVPEADAQTCRRWYDNNREKFCSQRLFEASHILYLAPREDAAARATAKVRAQAALISLNEDPSRFAEIARTQSKCSSAGEGGRLGQVALGETVPEIETFLVALEDGQICPIPVETEFGCHVLQLHHRIEGKDMSFDEAEPVIARELRAHTWRKAVSQYISLLAGGADVQGFDIKQATSPLVQ